MQRSPYRFGRVLDVLEHGGEERDEDEFVLMTDADMIFREPIDPIALGAARGVVISAEYTYLVGTESGFARRFLDESLLPRLAENPFAGLFKKAPAVDVEILEKVEEARLA